MKNVNDISQPTARQEIARTAARSVQSVRSTLAEQAGRAIADVKSTTDQQLERQKHEIVGSLRSVDSALRRTASKLDNPMLVPGVKRAAEAISGVGDYLETHRVDDVARSLRALSLKHPVALYSTVFALGFAAARLLSSNDQRDLKPSYGAIDLSQQPVSLGDGDIPSQVTEPMVPVESLRLQPEVF